MGSSRKLEALFTLSKPRDTEHMRRELYLVDHSTPSNVYTAECGVLDHMVRVYVYTNDILTVSILSLK